MNMEYYDLFEELRRRKIDPKLINRVYGGHSAFTLNYKCPVVIKKGGCSLDELADEYGFESFDKLYECIMNYKSKKAWERELEDYYSEPEEHHGYH